MAWSPTFEVAFDTDPGDEPGVWTDLSSRLRIPNPIELSTGAGRLTGGGEGDLSLTLDNYDRLIDPTNTAAALNLVPLRHARLTVTVGATTHPLFRGFVDEWPPMWSDVDSLVEVRLVDGKAWLGLQDADLDLPRQMSHERITALLDAAGWPAGLRDIGEGVVELEPYEQVSANLGRCAEDAADAEDGELYVAPDGKVTFRSRHHRFDSAPAVIFGTGGVPIMEAEPAWDAAWLTNIARVELEDGRVFETIDNASVTAYGPRVVPIRDLALRAAEAVAVAQWEVHRFAQPQLWIDRLTVDASEDDVLETLLALRIGNTAQILHTPPAGAAVDVTKAIEQITFSIEPNLCTARFDLSPYFGEGLWFTWDDEDRGWDMDAKWAP